MRGGSGAQRPSSAQRRRLPRHQQQQQQQLSSDFPAPTHTSTHCLGGIQQRHTQQQEEQQAAASSPGFGTGLRLSSLANVVCCHRDGGVGAQLPADTAQACRAGVRLPGALSGCGSRDEPGVGDRRRPVLPVSVGVLLEAGEHRELAVQQHSGLR